MFYNTDVSTPILATKLYIPPLRSKIVPRPRLIERLNEGLRHNHEFARKLTLISAPAGFGKTTVVNEWLAAAERPVAWLSLDEQDDDAIRFLMYIVAALQTIEADLGTGILEMLQSPQPPSPEAVLTILLNEIADTPSTFILVLDDYHVVDSKPIDDALTFLLEHLPPQMHIVITTRENPQLPLPRLQARGQLAELRAADLRFTSAEVASFLNQMMGLNLSAEEVTSLETRTEGWIAGLQLAALSMQGREDIPGFIRAFAGDNRYIVDYLVAEVLRRQPERIRSFLLQTSILERLCGSLCDSVTGQEEGKVLLETLEHSNLFVVPLDDKRQWYRYHHLFADVLQVHLLKEQPQEFSSLHQRASEWYERNDSTADAVHHALAAEDFERAAALIELAWPAIFKGHQPATWLAWVKALPNELVYARPVLSVGYAWTLLDGGELEAAEDRLCAAERWLDDTPDLNECSKTLAPEINVADMVFVNEKEFRSLPASIASARAYLAQAHGDVPATVKYARRALDLFPEKEHYQRGIAAMFLGLAYWTRGDLEAAHLSITDSVASLHMAGNLHFQILGTVFLADIKMVQGRLQEAASTYEQALELAGAHGVPELLGPADLYVGLGELEFERDDLETGKQHLQRAEKMGMQAVLPGSEARLQTALARIRQAREDLDGALDLLSKAERLYKPDPIPDMCPVGALKARIWLKQGRLAPALDWMREQGLSTDDDLNYLREFEHVTLARIFLAQYKQDGGDDLIHKTMGLLERLLQAAETGGRTRSVIEIRVLQALADQEQGDMSSALATIKHALTLAEPEGYIRIFADEGESMRELLAASLTQGTSPVYITRLINAIDPQPDDATSSQDPNLMLIEPLSDRELEVLGLLSNGLSNQAIAEELVIALSTVKKHVNNIFGKLHVGNRTQAVNRAQELNIL